MNAYTAIGITITLVAATSFALDGGFALLNKPLGWGLLAAYAFVGILAWGLFSGAWMLIGEAI